MEKVMEAFGRRLCALRKERHLKQIDMAKMLGCTDRHYQRMEYGQVNVPSLILVTLADFFGVTTDDLLGRG